MATLTRRIVYVGGLVGLALALGLALGRSYLPILPPPGSLGGRVSAYDPQAFILVALGLAVVAWFFVIPRMAQGPERDFLMKFLVVAFIAKMLGALVRLWSNLGVYGLRDVGRYDRVGATIADHLRHLEFSAVAPYLNWGTRFAEFYTGVVYAVVGSSLYAGFLVYAFFSFVGACFFYKAFRVAFPEGRYRLYAILVFLYPSVVYWPNGIGKDAPMALFMGLAAYGTALIIKRAQFSGLIPLVLGLAGATTVRPHITGMAVLALMAALLMGRGGAGGRALVTRVAVLGIAAVLVWFYTPAIMGFVGIDQLSVEGTIDYISSRQDTTYEGGSAFRPPSPEDPLFIPIAFVTLLFRPFVWEAHNIQALIQALDGLLLLGLVVWRAPVLVRAITSIRANPYLVYILAFLFMLAIALMTIANFGTITRERAMALPLLLMLLAFEPAPKKVAAKPS